MSERRFDNPDNMPNARVTFKNPLGGEKLTYDVDARNIEQINSLNPIDIEFNDPLGQHDDQRRKGCLAALFGIR